MKKNEIYEKKITIDIVVAGIKESVTYILEANEKELSALAERFDVEKIHFLKAKMTVYPGDIIKIKGNIESSTRRECVISLDKFDEKMKEKFEVFYADNPPTESDEIIDVINKGRIHLGEVVSEQYGLALNPFPKKRGAKNPYKEVFEEKQHPFSELKKFLKK